MDTKLFKFKINGDERGSLISLEEYKNIPSLIQSHDALEDAKIAREIYHMFQDEINQK